MYNAIEIINNVDMNWQKYLANRQYIYVDCVSNTKFKKIVNSNTKRLKHKVLGLFFAAGFKFPKHSHWLQFSDLFLDRSGGGYLEDRVRIADLLQPTKTELGMCDYYCRAKVLPNPRTLWSVFTLSFYWEEEGVESNRYTGNASRGIVLIAARTEIIG